MGQAYVAGQFLEFCTRQLDVHVLRPGGIGGDKRQVDLRGASGRELCLRLLGCLAQALDGQLVPRQINRLFFLELILEVSQKKDIEIFTAQKSIAVRGLHASEAV